MMAQSDEDALFKNVQDLRRKLQQTEHSLATLQQLEVRDGDDAGSLPSRSSSPGLANPLTMEELTPEEPFQGIHSLPRDNRQFANPGFGNVNTTNGQELLNPTSSRNYNKKSMSASNSKKHRAGREWREPKLHDNPHDNVLNVDREKDLKEMALSQGLHQLLADKRMVDLNFDGDVQEAVLAAAVAAGMVPRASSTQGGKMHIHGSKESQVSCSGPDSVHKKLQLVKEENSQLIAQNHKLLDQLESAGYQLHQANTRASQLMADLKGCKQQVSQLEDHVSDLDEALRQGEERYDMSQTQLEDLHQQLEDLQSQLEEVESENERYHEELRNLNAELEQEQTLRERTEEERDSAMQRIDELQNKLEEIQKRAKERIKKVQSSEEHLRENLCHADHDREELMEANDTLRKQLEVANRELRLLQENQLIDRETKSKLEQEAMDYQTQLRQMSSDMKKYEQELIMKETLMKENNELKLRVEELQRHLGAYQRQISDSQTQLHLLEERVSKIQQDKAQNKMETDSGVSLSKARSSTPDPSRKSCDPPATLGEGLDASFLETIRSQDTEISRVNAIEELREQLSQKDEEITELKHQLSLRLSPKPSTSQSIDALKKELQAVIDRHKQGEERLQEQEQLINKLQVERSRYTSQISGLEQKLADFEVQYASLEARFTQRQSQLSDIHKEITERENHISSLEREVRKRTSQIGSLENQLDGKVAEVTEQVARATELEEELVVMSGRMEKMRRELEDSRQGSRGNEAMMEKMRQLHSEQCQELERQLDMVSQKLERKCHQLLELEEDMKRAKDDLDIKDVALAEARRELELHSQQTAQRIKELEEKYRESTEKVTHLDSALHVCKEELRVNLEKMEDNHDLAERETLEREVMIADLQRQLLETQQLCEEKESQFATLEAALEDRQQIILESAERIVELEDGQTLLETQMGHLEQNLDRQKTQWVRDTNDMESKLSVTSSELQQRLEQVQELNDSIRDLAADKKKLGDDLTNLQKKYNRLKNEKEEKEKSVDKLESKLRDSQVELRRKSEMVEDMEEQLRALEYDFDERSERVNTLDGKLKDTQSELHMSRRRVQELEDEVDQALKDAAKKQEVLESLKHSLRCSQDELRSRNRELEDAEQVAKQQQWELEQRSKQISQIDRQVKERQSDLQGQVSSMENDLRKTQQELRAKEKKLLELEAEKQVIQGELNEKTHHLQQARGKLSQHQQDMDDITNKHRLTDREIQKLHTQLEDTFEENRDLLHQLTKLREEKSRLHQELLETSRDLAICHREQERLTRELADATSSAKDRQVQLGDELSDAKNREVQLEKNMTLEIQKMKQDMETMKEQHRNDLQEIEDLHEKTSENYLEQIEQQKEWLEDAKEREARLLRELEISQEEVANLQKEVIRLEGDLGKLENELHKRQGSLCEAQESLIMKDAEITRLEGRISSIEQIRNMKIAERMSALKGHSSNMSAPSMVHEGNSKDIENGSVDGGSNVFTSTPTKTKAFTQEGIVKMKVSEYESDRFNASSVSSISHAAGSDNVNLQQEGRETLQYLPEEDESGEELQGNGRHRDGSVFSSLEPVRKGSSDPDSLLGMWRQLQEQNRLKEEARSTDSHQSVECNNNNNVLTSDGSVISKSDDFESDASFGSKIPVQTGKGARPKVKAKKQDVFTRLSQPTEKHLRSKQNNNSSCGSSTSSSKTVSKSTLKSNHVKLAKPVSGKASTDSHKGAAAGKSGILPQTVGISPENRKSSIQSQYELMFGELGQNLCGSREDGAPANVAGSATGASAIQALGQQLLEELTQWQDEPAGTNPN